MLFSNETGLKKIDLPSNIKRIENGAFRGCAVLEEILIPSSVEYIGEAAFWRCESLKVITIPGSVKVVSKEAFCDCSNLRTVIIEEGVEEISSGAFSGCDNLIDVKLPNTLKKVGLRAFGLTIEGIGCSKLEKINVSDNMIRNHINAFDKNSILMKSFAYRYCPNCGSDYVGMLKKKCINCSYEKPRE